MDSAPLRGHRICHILRDMGKRLRVLLARALEALTPTVEDVADELRVSSSALRRYRLGDRTVPADLLRRLGRLMRRRVRRLEDLAARIEDAARERGDE